MAIRNEIFIMKVIFGLLYFFAGRISVDKIKSMTLLGASPTPMEYGELYTGLQNKLIDGLEINKTSISSEKLYEVLTYVSEVGLWPFPAVIAINLDFYNGLSPEDQQIFREAAKESLDYNISILQNAEDNATSIITASIMLIIAFGNIMGWTLAMDQIPAKITEAILSFSANPYVVMLLILLSLVVIGMVMEGFAALLIFAPVFTPLATSVGFDLVHFGVIFSIMINIGLITPPVGMVLFVTSNITGTPLRILNRSIVPFFIAAFIVTSALAFMPQITLFLPTLFYQ